MRALVVVAAVAACSDRPAPRGPSAGGGDAAVVDDEAVEAARIAAIERAVADLGPAVHLCWAAAATDDYRLAGRVSVLIDVDDHGAGAVTIHDDTTGDEVLTSCLTMVIGVYPWPPPMRGEATLLPLEFTAPAGQNVIDRQLVPEPSAGARVLLDGRNSGNRSASMFELLVPAGQTLAATASERAELWVYLDEPAPTSIPKAAALDAIYLPPKAARAPAAAADRPLRILIVSVPGGDEDATRATGVLPAAPATVTDTKRPAPVVAGAAGAFVADRPGVGAVTILVEPSRVRGAAVSASILDLRGDAAIPPHVHDGSTELLYLLEGAGTMMVDGVDLPVTATSVVQIPAGIEHAFTATEPARAIQVYAPPGPEQRFRQR
jgi:quercetin dioxygenase-like cupin family protein